MTVTQKRETGSRRKQRNPRWRPQLVALDIDGTLVDHDGALPSAIKNAVQRVVAAGVPVVLATGRSIGATTTIAENLGLPAGPLVCSNGAVTVSWPDGRVLEQITFDPGPVVHTVAEKLPHALIAVEDVLDGYRVSGEFPVGDLSGPVRITDLDDLASRAVSRVIIRDPHGTDADFMAAVDGLGLHEVSYFIGWSAWLDLAPLGVNKATALAEVCARLGVDPLHVLALGDGRNDIEMLRWAGRGVALAEAPDEVKAVATAVSRPFADGGTADELNRWFHAGRGAARSSGALVA